MKGFEKWVAKVKTQANAGIFVGFDPQSQIPRPSKTIVMRETLRCLCNLEKLIFHIL